MRGIEQDFKDGLLGILMRRYIRTNGTSEIQMDDLDEDERRQMRRHVGDSPFFTMSIGVIAMLEQTGNGMARKSAEGSRNRFIEASEAARKIN